MLDTLLAAFIISSRVTKPGGEAETKGRFDEETVLCLRTNDSKSLYLLRELLADYDQQLFKLCTTRCN